MVKINFRFTSPGIKVWGLFFFSPWKTSRAKLRSDNGYVVEMPILPRRVAGDLWWVMFFLPRKKEITEAGRCMPPQHEVKHLLRGGLEKDSWGASLLLLQWQPPWRAWWGEGEDDRAVTGSVPRNGRDALPYSFISLEEQCHKVYIWSDDFPLHSQWPVKCVGGKDT